MVPSPTNDAGKPVDGVAPVDTPNTPNSQETGKVSQGVLDALADYETFVQYHRSDMLGPINYALLAAAIAGAYAIEPPDEDLDPEPEYRYARAAARSAFHVCPALRGDR